MRFDIAAPDPFLDAVTKAAQRAHGVDCPLLAKPPKDIAIQVQALLIRKTMAAGALQVGECSHVVPLPCEAKSSPKPQPRVGGIPVEIME
jgi:hypothetical protein